MRLFLKIQQQNFYLNEFLNNSTSITSTKRLLETQKENSLLHSEMPPKVKYIIITEQCLCINLEKKALCKLSDTTDWEILKNLFQSEIVDKKDFFESLWKQKFSHIKHDGVIRAFIYRLKKRTGMKVNSVNGKLSLPDTLFI